MTYENTLHLYFLINFFIAGRGWDEDGNLWKEILAMLIIMLFGTGIGVCMKIWGWLVIFAQWTGLTIAYQIYVKKEWDNLTKEKLEGANAVAVKLYSGNSTEDRQYRFWVGRINKRNGYEPK